MKFLNKIYRPFHFSILFLIILIGILVTIGDQTYPKIIQISPKESLISARTKQVVLEFNRKVNRKSVEANFTTEPKLEGKFSWIGKKMAFSFNESLESGQNIKVRIENIEDEKEVMMKGIFEKNYRVKDQNLYFIGTQNEEKNQLIKYNLSEEKAEIWGPKNLEVTDYKISNDETQIYLFGFETGGDPERKSLFRWDPSEKKLEKIVDGSKEFIFNFNLSPNGELLLVRKSQFNKYDEHSLVDAGKVWAYQTKKQSWSPFWNSELYGGEMYFSPDSAYLVGRLISGDIIILPTEEDPDRVVYLENYGGAYHLSPDGSKLAFINFEDPFMPQDLLLRGDDGETQLLLEQAGEIQFPTFNQTGDKIYFLLSQASENSEGKSVITLNPYHLYYFDLMENKKVGLTQDSRYFEGFFTISSDGKKVVFERYKSSESGLFFESQLDQEESQSEIWLYDHKKKQLENLDLNGVKPFLS